MTELRYLPAADDVTEFTATVADADADEIVLDGTYFYPEGGGQPADRGVLTWDSGRATITDVQKDHGDVVHVIGELTGSVPAPGTAVEGQIDVDRRQQLRRMHTAQHVVSRVVLDRYDATTAGNQVYVDRSRIDFEPAAFDADDIAAIEQRTNEVIDRDLPLTKEHRPRAAVEAAVDEGRALLDLIPDHVDPLRVVEIDGFDLCPCGGTHVDRLGEVGTVEFTDWSSKGADTTRVEFVLHP